MDRRSIATLLIGMIAVLAGLWTATWMRMRRCEEAGGRWIAATRSCEPAAGGAAESTAQLALAWGVGALVALALTVMLWRIFLLASGRGPGREAG